MNDRRPPPPPAAPASYELVASRAAGGALFLGGGRIAAQALYVLSALVLARLLSPSGFGVFAIFLFFGSLLSAFGDASLGVSLVRRIRDPTDEDYRIVFSAQLLFVSIVAAVFWAAAPWFVRLYELPPDHVWLFRLVAFSHVLNAFQSVSMAKMERRMEFDRLALIEVAKSVFFNGILVGFVWGGYGMIGFAVADLLRTSVGVALSNAFCPWRPGWSWNLGALDEHLAFGIPYQGVQFITVVRQSITPLFIGLLLGKAAIGYVDWSMRVAGFSLVGVLALERLFVPAFARLQVHPRRLGRFVEQVLWVTNSLVAPAAVLILVLIEPIVAVVFGDQWLPALPLFYVLWVGAAFATSSVPLMGLVHALGKPRIGFTFTMIWMLATWTLGVPLTLLYGEIGFAVAVMAVQISSVLFYRAAQSLVDFRILEHTVPPWILAGVVGAGVAGLRRLLDPSSITALVLLAGAGMVAFVAGLALLNKREILAAYRWFRTRGEPGEGETLERS